MKDYYGILGVDKGASEAEIKKAYRSKARKLHPDIAGQSTENEEAFKELSNAYEVLGHADKRDLYDRGHDPLAAGGGGGNPFGAGGFGFNFDFGMDDIFEMFTGQSARGGRGQARQPRSRARDGEDVLVRATITLEESLRGSSKEFSLNLAVECDQCDGKGSASEQGEQPCPTCHGSGTEQHVTQSLFGQMVQQSVCRTCDGIGSVMIDPCSKCGGIGILMSHEKVKLDIPAGTMTGNRIRYTARGNAGPNGGNKGDLYVEITLKAHDVFELDGKNLVAKLDLPLTTALLGGEVSVDTLDGKHTVQINPGSASGQIISLSELGLPNHVGSPSDRAALKLVVEVEMPKKLNVKERGLVEELRKLLKDDKITPELTSLSSGGFWSKLKKKL
jgi:molecular chaperone DnaJ